MKLKILLFLSILFLIFTCKKIDETLLHGKWKVASMIEKGKPADKGAEQASFNFFPNGTYTYEISYYKEAGNYDTKDGKLYTTDTLNSDRIKKVVRVVNITSDSLVLEMNNSGIPQIWNCYKSPN
ncbi:MAG: lipocalin family protein [Saprospiraceae bacterium]